MIVCYGLTVLSASLIFGTHRYSIDQFVTPIYPFGELFWRTNHKTART